MLDDKTLIALAMSPSAREQFAERCYAGGYQALSDEESRRAALLFALVALSQPMDARAWLGLSRAVEQLELPEAAAGLAALAEAVTNPAPPTRRVGL